PVDLELVYAVCRIGHRPSVRFVLVFFRVRERPARIHQCRGAGRPGPLTASLGPACARSLCCGSAYEKGPIPGARLVLKTVAELLGFFHLLLNRVELGWRQVTVLVGIRRLEMRHEVLVGGRFRLRDHAVLVLVELVERLGLLLVAAGNRQARRQYQTACNGYELLHACLLRWCLLDAVAASAACP